MKRSSKTAFDVLCSRFSIQEVSMPRTHRSLTVTFIITVLMSTAVGLGREQTEYGPAKGSLVIAGGALRDHAIYEKLIELAGGREALFVVVPTAGGNRDREGKIREYKEEDVTAPWLKRGLKNVKMLHTHDPKVADTEEFVKDLKQAGAVWFNGGRQWNIVDSYAGTLTYTEFHKVLERGGVIGGSSAGATIQGAYLVRGAVAGPEIVMAPEPEHQTA
ncbi:MAG: hypothetical protein FJW35_16480, partial [Acidobacteria bacterium]|nr:hypothetical protein [Acidobacteriota bacterium]